MDYLCFTQTVNAAYCLSWKTFTLAYDLLRTEHMFDGLRILRNSLTKHSIHFPVICSLFVEVWLFLGSKTLWLFLQNIWYCILVWLTDLLYSTFAQRLLKNDHLLGQRTLWQFFPSPMSSNHLLSIKVKFMNIICNLLMLSFP